MNMKKLLPAIAMACAVLVPVPAPAHEAAAKHGGIVRTASDLHFEIVARGDAVVIYVEDHGKPLSTAGMTGKLTILRGTEQAEAQLQPAGENRLEAKGAKLGSGAKAVAVVTMPNRKTVTVRFALK